MKPWFHVCMYDIHHLVNIFKSMKEKQKIEPWLQTWGTSVFKVGPEKERNTG